MKTKKELSYKIFIQFPIFEKFLKTYLEVWRLKKLSYKIFILFSFLHLETF